MTALLTLILTAATTLVMAALGHRFQFAHFHLIGGIPVGAMSIGAGAALGVALAVRATSNHDTARLRLLGYLAGFTTYAAVVVADYVTLQLRIGGRVLPATEIMNVAHYLMYLVQEGAKSAATVVPKWAKIPPQIMFWVGMVRLAVEFVGTLVATSWMISLVTGVPFCWRNRRFYELKQLVESANTSAVREWELAVHQRRPMEARAILARVRAGKVQPQDRMWMRIAIHQCPICFAGRVRIEKRKRAAGWVRTEPQDEFLLDEARGSALLAT